MGSRLIWLLMCLAAVSAACSGTSDPATTSPVATSVPATNEPAVAAPEADAAPELGPGGYGFDRSDPERGVANIMEAFATDEATASCIFDAWGDVATIEPEELTPELMTFEICGTSIFQMMTGDPRFNSAGD